MDDLIGLIVIIVFGAINMIAQSSKKKRQREAQSSSVPKDAPKKEPSSLEAFFENLAEKLEPQKNDMPEWPEGQERPDYTKPLTEYNGDKKTEEYWETKPVEAAPAPLPAMEPILNKPSIADIKVPKAPSRVSLKTAIKSVPSTLSSNRGMRIASTPMLRSRSGATIDFSIRDKEELKKAMLANIVFSPPRAYDTSFDNVIVK